VNLRMEAGRHLSGSIEHRKPRFALAHILNWDFGAPIPQ